MTATAPVTAKSIIRVTRFQPFASRHGVDTVFTLSFLYDPALVELLKAVFARSRDVARDPAAHIDAAGGWLPHHKCWFVEPVVWPEIKDALEAAGYAIREEPT